MGTIFRKLKVEKATHAHLVCMNTLEKHMAMLSLFDPYIVMGETKHSYMLFLICSCTLNVHVMLFQSLLLFAKYSAHAR